VTTTIAPLAEWTALHPAALAWMEGAVAAGPTGPARPPRSRTLATALAATNRRWGNPVDTDLEAWLGGAETVVAGQQPGLAGGPLLTLVKACAVAAEVARRRAAGAPAVGFLWLATSDDDLPEMRWARVPVGEELMTVREEGWERGAALGGLALVGGAVEALLSRLQDAYPQALAAPVIALARDCFAPGTALGEACGRFLGRLVAGLGVVLVDSLEPELARAGREVVQRALQRLPAVHEALAANRDRFATRGWSVPIKVNLGRLPVFRREGVRREPLAARAGCCPDEVLAAHAATPEAFVPNVWLRPLVADEVLDTHTSILGGAELAYHLQAQAGWDIVGVGRPHWRLRPHVTVLTAAERRLARQLGLAPADLLRPSPPRSALPGGRLARRLTRLGSRVETELAAFVAAARDELPGAAGDAEATLKRVQGSLAWLEERLHAAALRASETGAGRWRRLRAFVRPDGHPQERHLSVLAPLLRLGLEWPAQLTAALDPRHPGMQLLGWEEGGSW